ncbi:PAQR family membrane homeostasis protein TrhA [Bifidobacterium sp.]|uniref:PAQR family membrane homeostasis protein TrhA n=1 Tax=Bifidobacterium sp. TaxID=41200 RepID=UPI0025BFAAB5|nr:hemolysin III family protein [Bifidobacterium sp.]MCH4209073.1 hemolysin III family protein [Bifidobacterium sp.]MCI1225405.1 hemolysin III family protein [Bifidobacterium sp.]
MNTALSRGSRSARQPQADRTSRDSQALRSAHKLASEQVGVDAFGIRKPRLRGWMHLAMFPLCIAASVVLICVAPGGWVKAACAVYGASAMLLFANSAVLHVVPWTSVRVTKVLCAIDYSNIFLIIAGTNTPILFALPASIRRPYLAIIWSTALIGTVAHILWLRAPGWVFTIVYVVLGLAPVTLVPQLWSAPAAGPAPTVLIGAGGAAYIAGAVCFAIHRPNPIPGWFEYHEVFHLGTIIGYVCHAVAVYLVVCSL